MSRMVQFRQVVVFVPLFVFWTLWCGFDCRAASPQENDADPSPANSSRRIISEMLNDVLALYQEERQAHSARRDQVTLAQRDRLPQIYAEWHEKELEIAGRAIELLQQNDDHRQNIEALSQLLTTCRGRAAERLFEFTIERYGNSEQVLPLLDHSLSASAESAAFLIRLWNESELHAVEGRAFWELTMQLWNLSHDVREPVKSFAGRYGEAFADFDARWNAGDEGSQLSRMIDYCRTTYGELPCDDSTIGEMAAVFAQFADVELLRPAPLVSGVDLEGEELNLTDHKGKVMALLFWGDWCPPCRAYYPHGRLLVRQLADQPFVLIGINSDQNNERIRRVVEEKNLSWRSFQDKQEYGKLSNLWNVRGWPSCILIDTKGVIRHRLHPSQMNEAIEELLREAGHEVEIVLDDPGENPPVDGSGE